MKTPKEKPRKIEIGVVELFLFIKIEIKMNIEPKVWGIKYFIAISLVDTENFLINIGIKTIRLISIITHKENQEIELIAKIEDKIKNNMYVICIQRI